jgi:Fe-S oxidoreductase
MELMDSFLLSQTAKIEPWIKDVLPGNTIPHGILLIEIYGENSKEIIEKIHVENKHRLYPAYSYETQERLWQIRSAAVPIINYNQENKKTISFVEDVIVPIHAIGKCITELYNIFKKYNVNICIYGHAGNGNLHIRPQLDVYNENEIKKMKTIADEVYDMVISLKGSITGEHGDGMLRVPYLIKQYGPVVKIFKQIKDIFDPYGMLNPGKIIGEEETFIHDVIYPLKPIHYFKSTEEFDISKKIARCHGCGKCRNICPVFNIYSDERVIPRAKMILLDAVITGKINYIKNNIVGLCISCHSCYTECPTKVDIPYILTLVKKNNIISNYRTDIAYHILKEPYRIANIHKKFKYISRIVLSSYTCRKLLEPVIGIDRRRKLPLPSVLSVEDKKHMYNSRIYNNKIAYFYGCWTNVFNTEVCDATIQLFNIFNYGIVFPEQRCCGMIKYTAGDINGMYKNMKYNIKHLYELVKHGYQIITTCPTCRLMLTKIYPCISSSPDTEAIAENVTDFYIYLWELCRKEVIKFKKIPYKKLMYHQPCHAKIFHDMDIVVNLLKLNTELEIMVNTTCCGMGGTFGIKKYGFDISMKIGSELAKRIHNIIPDKIITSCGACKTQIESIYNIEVIHPAVLLAQMLVAKSKLEGC